MAAIELHGWGATLDDPGHPDRIVLDLDPGEGVAYPQVVKAALDLRARLRSLGLESFCRTTGGKGLHVVVPLQPAADWGAVRDFAHGIARAMEAAEPERFVSTVPKATPARPHPGGLAAERRRLHRDLFLFAARPAGGDGRHAARLAGGDGEAGPGRLHHRDRAAAPGEAEAGPLGRLRRRRPAATEGTAVMAEHHQRPIWRGHLRLALVSCPIALTSVRQASAELHFHLINPKTGNRVRMVTLDAGTEKEVERSDLVKGYEFKKDTYVLLDDADFERAKIDTSSC